MHVHRAQVAAILVVIMTALVTTGAFVGAVGAEHTEGGIEIDIEGTATPGSTVTIDATLNGDAVVDAPVTVNDERVGTTNATGQIDVTVPNASRLSVDVETGDAFGFLEGSLSEDGLSTEHNETNETNETDDSTDDQTDGGTDDINVSVEGTVEPGNTVTVTGTLNGEPVVNATTRVNGERVGTTDTSGQIEVSIPEAPGVSINLLTADSSGVFEQQFDNDTDSSDGEVPDNISEDDIPDDGEIPDNVSDGDIPDDGEVPDNVSNGDVPDDGEIPDDEPDETENEAGAGSGSCGVPDDHDGDVPDDGEIPDNISDGDIPDDGEIPDNISDGDVPDDAPEQDEPCEEPSGVNASVVSTSVSHVGGPAPDTMPRVDAFTAGGLLQIQLKVPDSNLSQGQSSYDLSSLGVTKQTELQIDVRTESFEPRLLIGSGDDVSWSFDAKSNQTDIAITTKPISQQYLFPSDEPSPSIADWPSGADDQATTEREVTSTFAVDALSGPGQEGLQGGYIATDAQSFSTPIYLPSRAGQDPELRIDIAGPHLTVDGDENEGFYRAKLPDALLSDWGVSSGSDLTAAYKGSKKNFDTTNISDGITVGFDVSYSSGTVEISPNDTDGDNDTELPDNTTDDNDTELPDNTTDDNDTELPDNTTDDTGESGPASDPPATLASFSNTTSPGSVTPPSLSGKLRVESAVADNVSVELLREIQTNYSLAITAPESAANVTFYLQSQAVESSQNIQNVTMYLDGERQSFYVDSSAGPGNSPWIAFQIDHFSTRTVSFSSQNTTNSTDTVPTVVGDTPAQDLDGDGTYEDVNGDGTFNIVDVNAFFANRQSSSVQNNPGLFDFSGDGTVDIVDVNRLFTGS